MRARGRRGRLIGNSGLCQRLFCRTIQRVDISTETGGRSVLVVSILLDSQRARQTLTKVRLRVTCRSCGHKDVVSVVAKDYYAVGFKLKATCVGCGKPLGR
jgi:hypothetical protein